MFEKKLKERKYHNLVFRMGSFIHRLQYVFLIKWLHIAVSDYI